MKTIGIIAEFDPFHRGHAYLAAEAHRRCGADGAVVAAMSGHFTQRAAPAALRPLARAEMALAGGVDLVLELPLPWAVSSAERFALGGVQVLAAAGCDALAFGSECGDIALLRRCAAALESPDYSAALRAALGTGVSFAAARQSAVAALAGEETAAVLSRPNDLLGVSYLCAIRRLGVSMEPIAVPRVGAAHNAPAPEDGYASASAIRALLRAGQLSEAAALLPEESGKILRREWEAGLAAPSLEHCARGVLYRLRQMTEADFRALPDCSEGLEHRLYAAAQAAASPEEFCRLVKTKRYAYSRVRRLLLWTFLGLEKADIPAALPYLRVLGLNPAGQALLRRCQREGALPVLTRPTAVRRLSPEAQRLFQLELRSEDLWRLCLPALDCAAGGQGWRATPVVK